MRKHFLLSPCSRQSPPKFIETHVPPPVLAHNTPIRTAHREKGIKYRFTGDRTDPIPSLQPDRKRTAATCLHCTKRARRGIKMELVRNYLHEPPLSPLPHGKLHRFTGQHFIVFSPLSLGFVVLVRILYTT